MRHLILTIAMLLTGCNTQYNPNFDEDIKIIKEQSKHNNKKLVEVHCQVGLIIATKRYMPQLKGKVSKEQLDGAWKDCLEYGNKNE